MLLTDRVPINVPGRPMLQRAWSVPAGSVVLAALVSLALSTQLMFQRQLYDQWSPGQIAGAWLHGWASLAAVAGVILGTLGLAGRVPVQGRLLRLAWFGTAVLAGALAGEWLVLWYQWGEWPTADLEALLPRAMRWLPIAGTVALIQRYRAHVAELAARTHDEEVTRLQLEQQQVAVQLQVLQSQIEPHFLFNTLATVRRLHQTDPRRGRETLSDFIHYLRASLPGMRDTEVTLGREVDLIAAYLDVLAVRMGERLTVRIEVPETLRSLCVPPLSLATLVENSVKHGLATLPEGGVIAIRAWRDDDRLYVSVADTGVGLTAAGGSGMGLANLRIRLRGLYGDRAALLLQPNAPRGLAATIALPASIDPVLHGAG